MPEIRVLFSLRHSRLISLIYMEKRLHTEGGNSLHSILKWKRPELYLLLFALAFSIGISAARIAASKTSSPASSSAEGNWGLSFQKEGAQPIGNADYEELKQYHAGFIDNTEEKIIYLTFDCGYENGYTPAILDALNKHQAPATFFVVGTYAKSNPDLIRRMAEEGHTIGNHTYHHPDMSKISTKESFQKELTDVETLVQDIAGQPMSCFYRPPQGKYSQSNLKMADELGYQTFFWSLAYVDWYQDDQPTKEEAFKVLLKRIHPGAVVLLHNTSSTNAAILDELLTKWEEMGYRFEPLENLAEKLKAS